MQGASGVEAGSLGPPFKRKGVNKSWRKRKEKRSKSEGSEQPPRLSDTEFLIMSLLVESDPKELTVWTS